MHQVKKGNKRHFGMKAHISVDADSVLMHTVIVTAANIHEVTQSVDFLHGEENLRTAQYPVCSVQSIDGKQMYIVVEGEGIIAPEIWEKHLNQRK